MISQDGAMFCLELDWWEFSTLREAMEEEQSCTRALGEADDKDAILER